MNTINQGIVDFERYDVLRHSIGFAGQLIPLVYLSIRAFQESLTTKHQWTIARLALMIWGVYVALVAVLDRVLLPRELLAFSNVPVITSSVALALIWLLLTVIAKYAQQSWATKSFLLLLLYNHHLFIINISRTYVLATSHGPFTAYHPYRLDGLIVYGILTLISIPFVKRILDELAKMVIVLPASRLRRRLFLIPSLGAAILSGLYVYMVWQMQLSDIHGYVLIGVTLALMPSLTLTLHLLRTLMHNELLRKQHSDLIDGYGRVQDHIQTIHEMKHDLAAHLIWLHSSLEEGEYDRAQDYITDLIELSGIEERIFYSNHPLINGILNYCMLRTEGTRIILDANIRNADYSPLSDTEITALLSNLMTNAIDELEHLPDDAPDRDYRITLTMDRINDYLIVSSRNKLIHEVYWEEGQLQSTKVTEQSPEHGHGLRIVEKILHRHDGHVLIQPDQETFHISLTVPIEKEEAYVPHRVDRRSN